MTEDIMRGVLYSNKRCAKVRRRNRRAEERLSNQLRLNLFGLSQSVAPIVPCGGAISNDAELLAYWHFKSAPG